MYRLLFHPRSLLQLVIIAFILVLAPLVMLLYQAMSALEGVSRESRLGTIEIVSLAKASQRLPEIVLDMEHAARQYQVVGAIKLKRIYRLAGRRLNTALEPICEKNETNTLLNNCETLEKLSQSLLTSLNAAPYDSRLYETTLQRFDELSSFTQTFAHDIQLLIEHKSEQLANDAEKVKSHLLWQSISLIPLSIFLSIVFTYLITRPIQRLERIIQQLGSGEEIQYFKVSGPKELHNLGEKLSWLQSRLHTLELEKLSFIRQMSHELKTPLASIREGADLLTEKGLGSLTSEQEEIVHILQDKGLQLQRIIENLLDYNALKFQKGISPTRFDFSQLVQEVLFEHRLDLQKARIFYCLDGGAAELLADRIKLRTLLANLISNAIYYSSLPARIWLSWHISDKRLIFKIANHGQPISEEEKVRIFLPFEQGSQARSGTIKGSGIGLSVALECALLHHGNLKLIPDPIAEICFQLELPTSFQAQIAAE